MQKNIERIVGEKSCYGCGVCENICPVHAISMKYDSEGFLNPYIEKDICIDCGKCLKMCINYNPVTITQAYKEHYYYGSNNNITELKKSASGGAAYLIAKRMMQKFNAKIYGVGYSKHDSLPEYVRIDSVDELCTIQGTKYAQAKKGEIYKQIYQDLSSGEYVLFFGTPCEIAAIKRFLDKDYEKFYSVQLICMGTTSPKAFRRFIVDKAGEKTTCVVERFKKTNWEIPYVYIENDSGKLYCRPFDLSEYSFIFKWVGRTTCYNCQYKGEKRVADLTIGDFWGIKHYLKKYNKMGMSIVSVHSKKGCLLLDDIKFVKVDYDSTKFNPYIHNSRNRNKKREYIIGQIINGKAWNQVIWENSNCKERVKYIFSIFIPNWLWNIICYLM